VASPFSRHYKDTSSIHIEPFIAPLPPSSPWAPTSSANLGALEDDVFTSSAWSNDVPAEAAKPQERSTKIETVTLSQLLDNVVILEESIKELVAFLHARRCLGIDSIRYL